jgi:hypothetical protein
LEVETCADRRLVLAFGRNPVGRHNPNRHVMLLACLQRASLHSSFTHNHVTVRRIQHGTSMCCRFRRIRRFLAMDQPCLSVSTLHWRRCRGCSSPNLGYHGPPLGCCCCPSEGVKTEVARGRTQTSNGLALNRDL